MPVQIPTAPRTTEGWNGPHLAIVVLTLAIAAAAFTTHALFPRSLLLPILSVFLVTLAAGVALLAWRLHAPQFRDRTSYWDIAGALTLFGIAAALLSDPAEVIPLRGAQGAVIVSPLAAIFWSH